MLTRQPHKTRMSISEKSINFDPKQKKVVHPELGARRRRPDGRRNNRNNSNGGRNFAPRRRGDYNNRRNGPRRYRNNFSQVGRQGPRSTRNGSNLARRKPLFPRTTLPRNPQGGFDNYFPNAPLDLNENKRIEREKEPGGDKNWFDPLVNGVSSAASTLFPLAEKLLPLVITGLGDYKIEPPVQTNSVVAAMTGGELGNEVPIMHNDKVENVISRTEYIGDIVSSTLPFSAQTFPINPGMDETFPWLAPMGNNYTQHRWRGLVFEIKTEASDYTNSVGLGYMAMATQYNSAAPDFTDKKSMLNYENASSGKPSENLLHAVECKKSDLVLDELYNRSGAIPSNSDIRFYDIGELTVAVGGQSVSGVVIGELWATYEIEFYAAKSSSSAGVNVGFDAYNLGVATSGALPLGNLSNPIKLPNSNLGTSLLTTSPTLVFPPKARGRYLIDYFGTHSVNYTVSAPPLTLTNCVLAANMWRNQTQSQQFTPGGLNLSYSHQFYLDINQDNATILWSVAGTVAADQGANLTITQVPRADNFTISPIFRHHLLKYRDQAGNEHTALDLRSYDDSDDDDISDSFDEEEYDKLMKKMAQWKMAHTLSPTLTGDTSKKTSRLT